MILLYSTIYQYIHVYTSLYIYHYPRKGCCTHGDWLLHLCKQPHSKDIHPVFILVCTAAAIVCTWYWSPGFLSRAQSETARQCSHGTFLYQVCTSMYQYVLWHTRLLQLIINSDVLVCTWMYWYVPSLLNTATGFVEPRVYSLGHMP